MGYVLFGLAIGFIVSWLHMANLLRDGQRNSLPGVFLRNPFHPAIPFTIVFQLITGGVPKLRQMFLWTVAIYGTVAWLVVAGFHKLFG
jgi:hypothetical protein